MHVNTRCTSFEKSRDNVSRVGDVCSLRHTWNVRLSVFQDGSFTSFVKTRYAREYWSDRWTAFAAFGRRTCTMEQKNGVDDLSTTCQGDFQDVSEGCGRPRWIYAKFTSKYIERNYGCYGQLLIFLSNNETEHLHAHHRISIHTYLVVTEVLPPSTVRRRTASRERLR